MDLASLPPEMRAQATFVWRSLTSTEPDEESLLFNLTCASQWLLTQLPVGSDQASANEPLLYLGRLAKHYNDAWTPATIIAQMLRDGTWDREIAEDMLRQTTPPDVADFRRAVADLALVGKMFWRALTRIGRI